MKNYNLAKKMLKKKEKEAKKALKGNKEAITFYNILSERISQNKVLNDPNKSKYTDGDLLDLINEYGEKPDYFFLFCKKDNLMAANVLYNKSMKESTKTIVDWHLSNNDYYCESLVDATIFDKIIETRTTMKIAGKSLEDFLEFCNDHIANFNNLYDDTLEDKLKFFELNQKINHQDFLNIKEFFSSVILKEKKFLMHLKSSDEDLSTDQLVDSLFFDIFPKVFVFDVIYKFNKKTLSYQLEQNLFENGLIEKIQLEKELLLKNKKEKKKLYANMSFSALKLGLAIFCPMTAISSIKDGVEILDNIKDGLEFSSDVLNHLSRKQLIQIRQDFLASDFDNFKQYFFSEIKRGFTEFLKTSSFKIENISIDIPDKDLYNIYNTFVDHHLLKNINQKSAVIMEQSRNVPDLAAFYLDVIDSQSEQDLKMM